MRASVVIPTFNRLEQLQTVVAAVQSQTLPPAADLEIIIVDDGSTDGTSGWLDELSGRPGIKTIRQKNSGPARARNRGVEAATGDIVFFLGDDTEPETGWLGAHLEEHRRFGEPGPLAVLGYTSFSPDIESPFLRFINEFGAQFGYLLIEDPTDVPFNFFYTSNISLPRSELVNLGGFREDFPQAAWEDIEFAYRAVGDGLRIRYQPRARTLHQHCIQPRSFCRRQRTSGRSAAIFAKLHPELSEFLGVHRSRRITLPGRLCHGVLWVLIELGEKIEGIIPHRVYQSFLDRCYLEGLAEGLHGS